MLQTHELEVPTNQSENITISDNLIIIIIQFFSFKALPYYFKRIWIYVSFV